MCTPAVRTQLRASAIEVVRKLADEAFVRTLRATGEVEQVFTALLEALLPGDEADLILDASVAIFLACILRDSRSAGLLIRSSESCQRIIDVLARLVCAERADEPLSEANRTASKNEKRMLASVGQIVDDTAVLSSGPATVRGRNPVRR